MRHIVAFLSILCLISSVRSQSIDHDGQLVVLWSAPAYGDSLDHYVWSYTINECVDSVTGASPAGGTSDNSIVLTDPGDRAVFHISAVSINGYQSSAVTTDTIYFTPYGCIAGWVSDTSGNPIEGVFVEAVGTNRADYSDLDGEYILDSLSGTTYNIIFSHSDYMDTVIWGVHPIPGDTTILDITMFPDIQLIYIPGDFNGDRRVIGGDVTFGVNYFRGHGAAPPDSCWNDSTDAYLYCAADANGNCIVQGSDITFLVAYFRSIHQSPQWCPQTPPYPPE